MTAQIEDSIQTLLSRARTFNDPQLNKSVDDLLADSDLAPRGGRQTTAYRREGRLVSLLEGYCRERNLSTVRRFRCLPTCRPGSLTSS